jgi:hypothetical protein
MIGDSKASIKIRPTLRLIRSMIGADITPAFGKSGARMLLTEAPSFRRNPPLQTVKVSLKEAQSFPELWPITTLVFPETQV